MKKINSIIAALATLVLASCVNEQFENGVDLSNMDIAFVFGGTTTRSEAKSSMDEEVGVTLSLGSESGVEIFMKETVTDLNSSGLATRGVPVYDENITSLEAYQSFEAVAYLAGGAAYDAGTATFASMGYQKNVDNRDGWVYKHHYDAELPWPENPEQDLYFFLRLPTDYVDSHLYTKDGSDISYNSTTGAITFNFASPLTGEAQSDILFSSRTLNRKQYEENYQETGAPVNMYHALTGVKFRTGNDNTGSTKTIITGVSISGLKDKGQCVVTPSATGDKVVWDKNKLELSNEKGVTFTMGFDNPEYDRTKDNTIDYSSKDNDGAITDKVGSFGDSWYAAADDKNLNDEDGSKTFWLIPQEIPDDAILKVKFRVKTPDTPDGTEITHTINNFGAKLKKSGVTKNVEWKAGQLRTYTLEPEDVDVEIFDTMDGAEKSNLHVTNTGNVDEWVRMMVIGNWCDEDGNIVVGYKYQNEDDEFEEGEDYSTMVKPWFRGGYAVEIPVEPGEGEEGGESGEGEGQTTNTYVDPYGSFDDTFTLGEPQGDSKWERGSGSYFYYTQKIGAGQKIDSQTEALFQSYTLTSVPDIYIPSPNGGRVKANIHLELEVVIQAIGAKDASGNEFEDCWEAWTYATGTTVKSKKE